MHDLLHTFRGKRILLTGHTGFKGAWMCRLLLLCGAQVTGYALDPPTDPSIWALCGMEKDVRDIRGDVRDLDALRRAFDEARPEIVVHMAAQPIVLESYRDPAGTYATNVMGTVNVLECIRLSGSVCSALNVTTDKVYRNEEWPWGYRETDTLEGFDPYANSKSCSELVTSSYVNSFLRKQGVAVSTARAGNVIGGGDFAADRIVPDCVRAASAGKPIILRNPHSIRPYQHVLDALWGYLAILSAQQRDASVAGCYNVGPGDADCVSTGTLAELFCAAWGDGLTWEAPNAPANAPHESNFLRLDTSKIRSALGWTPAWDIRRAIGATAGWTRAWLSGQDIAAETDRQIGEYIACLKA